MRNLLAEALGTSQSLFRSDVFEAAVIDHSGAQVIVRRPNSTQSEGPYRCLGAPPPVGSIVSVMRFGNRHVCLTHHSHQAYGGPREVSSDYTTVASDVLLKASPDSGDIRITLTNTHPSGAEMTIKRIYDGTANSVFVENGAGQIEDLAEIELAAEGDAVILRKFGSDWYIMAGWP